MLSRKLQGAGGTIGGGGGGETWDLSAFSATGDSKSIGNDIRPQGLFFSSDGTKMYVSGSNSEAIDQFNLSVAWDITSAGSSVYQLSATNDNPNGIYFKSDGLKLYASCSSTGEIEEFTLSTAWDLSTASSTYVLNTTFNGDGIFFKPDGTKAFVSETTNDRLRELDLSAAWDISTAVDNGVYYQDAAWTAPFGVSFNPNGLQFFVVDRSDQFIRQYSLSTAWDLSTASDDDVSIDTNKSVTDIYFKDGNTFFITEISSYNVYEYST